MLEKHEKSGNCDPKKKKKPTCPVRQCKEILPFSNIGTCKTCQLKVRLKHRFWLTTHANRWQRLLWWRVREDGMIGFLLQWLRGMEEIYSQYIFIC
ncbi:hypothetical protein SO802_025837 [Lithocarpus litseifolius]|uniref:Uncharacterized protein n=1 Tax=Lithocarpus litseifolius TaxID=425828 RepID=A0AAW2BYD2_9ROSI